LESTGFDRRYHQRPSNYRRLLGKPASKIKFFDRVSDGSDFVHFFSMHRSELEKAIADFFAQK